MSRRRLRVRTELAVMHALVFLVAGLVFFVVNFGIIERLDVNDDDDPILDAIAGLVIVSVAGGAGGWMMAGRALRPLRSITSTAQRVSAATLDQRIALDGPDDEVKELADTIDALLDRLEAAFTRERRFVANASHELRTPLAVTRTALELGLARGVSSPDELRDAVAQALRATARSEALVNDLLLLARSETLDGQQWEPFDLAELAREVIDHLAGQAADTHVEVHTDLRPAPMTGVAGLVDRLVVNLVDNAIRHNHHGGHINIHTQGQGASAHLTITNSCAASCDTTLDTLFEPFQRGTAPPGGHRPPGNGLGLSIVRAIAEGHHAHLRARLLDHGARFDIGITFVEQGTAPPRTAVAAPSTL